MDHYYKTLNLTPSASLSDIKKAYRKQALLYHPDRNSDPNAQEIFLKIDEAYDYLVKLKSGKLRQWTAPQYEAIVKTPEELERERKLAILRAVYRNTLDEIKTKANVLNFLMVFSSLVPLPLIVGGIVGALFNSINALVITILVTPIIFLIFLYSKIYNYTEKLKADALRKFNKDRRNL